MSPHLPVLQVVVPLLAAPLCVILRQPLLARLWATLITWLSALIAWLQLSQVRASGPISYHQGGWAPPWGIEYRVDVLTAYVLLVVTFVASVVISVGIGPDGNAVSPKRHALYYAAFLLCLTGMLGMTATGDAFNVFVFLEISSLSSYTLIAIGNGKRALTAALNYLMMGTVGGTFILIGIGLMYQATGTLNMADLALRLQPQYGASMVKAAFAFTVLGLAIKLAMFPVHQWLPNAYAFAPSAVSAFVAGTSTKVIYYLLLRFLFTIFGARFAFDLLGFDKLLLVASLAAMFAGSLAAIFQSDLKRLLAYSSVAQIGYLTLAVGLRSEAGVTAGLLHLFNHALMKSAMFLAVACLVARLGSASLTALHGKGSKMPLTMAALVAGGFGLIGVPGTGGFVSKWYLVSAALERGNYPVAALILASSLLAVIYVWRIIEAAYFKTSSTTPLSDTARRGREEAPLGLLVPTGVLALASLYFGVFTELPVSLSTRAAHALWGGG